MFDFSGKHALITGGTGGLGAAIARAFQQAGCRVCCTGAEEEAVARFQARHPEISVCLLDVTSTEQVEELAGELSQLDILVNCAGTILRDGQEFRAEGFSHVVDVNLTGTLRICEASHAHLKESGGCIINIASMLSLFGSPYAPAYSSSKGGIVQLTKSLAAAWADDDIRVNAVAPGWIRTAMTQPLIDNEERSRTIVARTPLGRWGNPDDIAGAVLFLCSPAATFITGAVLPVDGGYSIS